MKIIDKILLDETTAMAKESPRLRMNHNFHERLDNSLNRLINAMEPETYLRPHRHCDPDKDESFLLLRGKVAFFTFDNAGNVTEKLILSPEDGVFGADIQAGVWHGMLVLESGSVVYEAKEGPYTPLTSENMAPWSPDTEDKEGIKTYLKMLESLLTE